MGIATAYSVLPASGGGLMVDRVKFVERLNVRQAMEQSERDAVGDELPILAHKTSRKEWLVTMRADDWFLLYRPWMLSLIHD